MLSLGKAGVKPRSLVQRDMPNHTHTRTVRALGRFNLLLMIFDHLCSEHNLHLTNGSSLKL